MGMSLSCQFPIPRLLGRCLLPLPRPARRSSGLPERRRVPGPRIPNLAGREPRAANPRRRLPFWQFPGPSPLIPRIQESTSDEPRAASDRPRAWPPLARFLFPVACSLFPVPGPWPMTDDKGPMTVVPHSALVTPFPALLYGHTCPQVSGFSPPRCL